MLWAREVHYVAPLVALTNVCFLHSTPRALSLTSPRLRLVHGVASRGAEGGGNGDDDGDGPGVRGRARGNRGDVQVFLLILPRGICFWCILSKKNVTQCEIK